MRYDRKYFEKWYRNPRHRVRTAAELERQVRFVVAMAEHLLNHPVRTVLDIGAGEGAWLPVLRKLRPRIRYWGVDPSEYAVRKHGARRNIVLGDAAALDDVERIPGGADLVVCSSVLNYLSPPALKRALSQLAQRTDGMAFLELYTGRDLAKIEGDIAPIGNRSAAWYLAALRAAGFIPCGMHCYVTGRLASRVTELERACGDVPRRRR